MRNLLLSTALIAAAPMFAATYYVSPEGAGTKDGSSWENAFGVEELTAKASTTANGDIFNFAGGVYKPTETIVFNKVGVTFNGNTNGERTIFSGDKNGNNNPESGDLSRLLRFQPDKAPGDRTADVIINNIDFTCVYTVANADRGDSKNTTVTMGALMIDNCGYAEINYCNFYNNWAQGTGSRPQGGAAANFHRSSVNLNGCVFRNNHANYRGGAIFLSSNASNKGITSFTNCLFKDNTNYHNLGGAICVQQAKKVSLIGCTMVGNKSASFGSAIYLNAKDKTYANELVIINSTIANNTSTGEETDMNGQVFSNMGANIKIVNSIVVSSEEKTPDFFFNPDNGDVANFSFVSGGYNIVGSEKNAPAPAAAETPATRAAAETNLNWLTSDYFDTDHTHEAIFGNNTLNDKNQLHPVKFLAGATSEQLAEATKDWGLPEGTDLSGRTAGMTPGAVGLTNDDITTDVSEITDILSPAEATLSIIAPNVYRIQGAAMTEVYSISGAKVAAINGDTVDMNDFSKGIYIIHAGNKSFKVTK